MLLPPERTDYLRQIYRGTAAAGGARLFLLEHVAELKKAHDVRPDLVVVLPAQFRRKSLPADHGGVRLATSIDSREGGIRVLFQVLLVDDHRCAGDHRIIDVSERVNRRGQRFPSL